MGSDVAIRIPTTARARLESGSEQAIRNGANSNDRPQAAAGPLKLR